MKRIILVTATVIATMALVGCGGGGGSDVGVLPIPTPTPIPYTAYPFEGAPAIDAEKKDAYLKAINDARAVEQDCGTKGIMPPVAPLAWSEALYLASYEHGVDMDESDHYEHIGSGTESDWTMQVQGLEEGSSPTDRAKNNGYNGNAGENISKGTETLEEVIAGWLESDNHCANIMYDEYDDVGMSLVEGEADFWTQNFGVRY